MSVALVLFLCFAGAPSCETIMDRPMPGPMTCNIRMVAVPEQMTSAGRKRWLRVLRGSQTLTQATVEYRWEIVT
jgi:hypothetical protein